MIDPSLFDFFEFALSKFSIREGFSEARIAEEQEIEKCLLNVIHQFDKSTKWKTLNFIRKRKIEMRSSLEENELGIRMYLN